MKSGDIRPPAVSGWYWRSPSTSSRSLIAICSRISSARSSGSISSRSTASSEGISERISARNWGDSSLTNSVTNESSSSLKNSPTNWFWAIILNTAVRSSSLRCRKTQAISAGCVLDMSFAKCSLAPRLFNLLTMSRMTIPSLPISSFLALLSISYTDVKDYVDYPCF